MWKKKKNSNCKYLKEPFAELTESLCSVHLSKRESKKHFRLKGPLNASKQREKNLKRTEQGYNFRKHLSKTLTFLLKLNFVFFFIFRRTNTAE